MTFKELVGMACFNHEMPPNNFLNALRELERLGWKIVGPGVTQSMIRGSTNRHPVNYFPLALASRDRGEIIEDAIKFAPTIDDLLSADKRKK